MHTSHPTVLDAPLTISCRNHQNSLTCFSPLAPLVLFFFAKRQSQKGRGGAWNNGSPSKYAPEYSACDLISKSCFARMDA